MFYKLFIVTITCVVITGCSSKFKQKVGLTTLVPDENQVQQHKPLEVPPHYELKAPTEHKKK
ncbi:MAG: DUF3035 domain-containing protein [Pseudomonadota bacterium]